MTSTNPLITNRINLFAGNVTGVCDAKRHVKTGQRAGPARPWLGVAADEVQGRLVVARVSPDGPGDRAGLRAGDIILAVGGDGVRTRAEFYRTVWSRGGAGTDIPLRVLQGIDVREITVHTIDRVDYFRPRTTY